MADAEDANIGDGVSPFVVLILLVLGIAAITVLWFITPVWQCPICHSYKVAEAQRDGVEWLECLNEECRHTWRAI